MTYDSERVLVGREPLAVCDITVDSCSLTYGVAPCTASGASGSECYNTRFTTQDADNYTKTTKTYRFCESRYQPKPGEQMYPALESWKVAPTKLTPGKGLGHRSSVTLTFRDFPHHDRGVDPYVANRSYTPEDQGTFFGKWIARNGYYQNRPLKIRRGYVSSSGLDLTGFSDHLYLIDRVEGPDANGVVRIVAKDVLKLVDDKKAQAPAASSGVLSADITAGQTTLVLDDSTGYPSSGHVRIGSEIMSYTAGSAFSSAFSTAFGPGDTTLSVTRAQRGTTGKAHKSGDSVQLCVTYDSTTINNAVDVAFDLIDTYSEVDTDSYIDFGDDVTYTANSTTDILTATGHGFATNDEVYTSSTGTLPDGLSTNTRYWVIDVSENSLQLTATRGGSAVDLIDTGSGTHSLINSWNYERDTWLQGKLTDAIISKPTGINKLLGELTEQFGFDIWWDEQAQKIRLKANAPARFGRTAITSVIKDSAKSKQLPADRVSQMWVFFERDDWSKSATDRENYLQTLVTADLTKEATDLYGEPKIEQIYSRWIPSQAVAASASGRRLARFAENPTELMFTVDAGATLPDIAEEVRVTTRAVQDTAGADKAFDCQITAKDEAEQGSTWVYTALTSAFTDGRYGFVGPNTLSDYTAETEANQNRYAWIAATATEQMSNGDLAYRII